MHSGLEDRLTDETSIVETPRGVLTNLINNIMTKSQKQGRLYLQVTIVLIIITFNLITYLLS